MVDKQEIRKLFKHWFYTDSAVFEINDDGTISCEGSITTDYKFPGKLPVKFKKFTGALFLTQANLHTLEGAPEYMDGNLRLRGNQLTNLIGAPEVITGVFNIMQNPLTSLKGFPSRVGTVVLDDDPKLPMLRLLTAQEIKIQGSRDPNYTVSKILNQYAGQGEAGAFACGTELASAGFKENARW